MQRLEVSGAVQLIYRSLGVKGLRQNCFSTVCFTLSPSKKFAFYSLSPFVASATYIRLVCILSKIQFSNVLADVGSTLH